MSFLHPWVLLLLIVPVALLARAWAGDAWHLTLHIDHSPLRSRPWIFGLLGLFETWPVLLLAVAIVLLAGPQRLGQPVTKRVLTNIEFCVDISGSMSASMGDGTRYDVSMAAINSFLDYRQGDAFGLTFFANNVLHWVPLTSDPSAIRCSPPFMRPELAPPWMGGTEIGKALSACRAVLAEREEGDRMIVLISDGESSDLMQGQDVEIAKQLAAERIAVYAIHVADGDPPDPIVNIAGLTGGEVFQAGDQAGVTAVFARIDQMQATRMARTAALPQDNFRPCCWAGLTLLSATLLGQLGFRYTPW